MSRRRHFRPTVWPKHFTPQQHPQALRWAGQFGWRLARWSS